MIISIMFNIQIMNNIISELAVIQAIVTKYGTLIFDYILFSRQRPLLQLCKTVIVQCISVTKKDGNKNKN